MTAIIKLIPLEEYGRLDYSNKKTRIVKPGDFGYSYKASYELPEGVEQQILEAAKDFDGICVAVIVTALGEEFVHGCSEAKGCTSRPYFYNATECNAFEAEHKVALYNTGRGALTRYWWERHLKFEKGGVA